MTEQIKKDMSWGQIARAMITATGEARFDDDGKSGALFNPQQNRARSLIEKGKRDITHSLGKEKGTSLILLCVVNQ